MNGNKKVSKIIIAATVLILIPAGSLSAAELKAVEPRRPLSPTASPAGRNQTAVPAVSPARTPLSRANTGQTATAFSGTGPDSQILGALQQTTGELGVDIQALVMWVMMMSYSETVNDLAMFAEKVKAFNSTKQDAREHLDDLRAEGRRLYKVSEEALRRYECNVYRPTPRPPGCPPPGTSIPTTVSPGVPSLIASNIRILDKVDKDVAGLEGSRLTPAQEKDLEMFKDAAARYRRIVERFGRLYKPLPQQPPAAAVPDRKTPAIRRPPPAASQPAPVPVMKKAAPPSAGRTPAPTQPAPVIRPLSPALSGTVKEK